MHFLKDVNLGLQHVLLGAHALLLDNLNSDLLAGLAIDCELDDREVAGANLLLQIVVLVDIFP